MIDLPHVWTPESLREQTATVGVRDVNGIIRPLRPLCYHGLCLRRRIKLAWRVFTGKADVLEWETY